MLHHQLLFAVLAMPASRGGNQMKYKNDRIAVIVGLALVCVGGVGGSACEPRV